MTRCVGVGDGVLGDRKKEVNMAMASATAVGPSVCLRGQNTYVLEGTQELGNSTPQRGSSAGVGQGLTE